MEDLDYIKRQLKGFIKKYYLNELLKGVILFFSIWLLYFIFILLIEYFFWLSPPYRSLLFWFCILVSVGLFYRFVLISLAKLFRLSRGIDQFEASRIIGKHFPEVGDKLVNVLQLQNNPHKSDLLLAGIAQKSRQLRPVPFKMAVNYKSSLKYLKYAAFPVSIILAVIITGNTQVFSESYIRMVDYKRAYEPPAPFSFRISNDILKVEEGSSLTLNVETAGSIIPENASIYFGDQMYYLKSTGQGLFQYTFQGVKQDLEFFLGANGITSKKYEVEVVKVPKLLDFEMELEFPGYLSRPPEIIKGTGNMTIPEGTRVTWKLRTQATDKVAFIGPDTIEDFIKIRDNYSLSKRIYNNTSYQISTSNLEVRDYETLAYNATVIKDQYPEIAVEQAMDSISNSNFHFYGKVSDDHAISAINLVYFPDSEEHNPIKVSIPVSREVFAEFFYSFPGTLNLEGGTDYTFYFEVFDNDGIRGPKRSKTGYFGYRQKSEDQIKEEQLQMQGESIDNLSRSLDKMELTEKELEDLSRLQREKEKLNFNDRKKLEDFLERQKTQNEVMKNYSEKLKQSLENTKPVEDDLFKNELRERLERTEKRLEDNEALLEELQEYSEKISREDLSEKLEQLSKQNTNEQKSLEQLLELTKRYYVQEKTKKLASDLSNLAEKQERLGEDSLNSEEAQEMLNEEFERFQKQMEDLEKENAGLKKPFTLGRDEEKESDIRDDQEKALEELGKDNPKEAGKKQEDAGKKMKEMSMNMQSMQIISQGQQLNVNIESLRQILDNLMVFSFKQEELLLKFRSIRPNNPGYARELRSQQVLKEHFQHIDDSLFALAVNNPMITEKITAKLTDIEFDIEKSLERLAQNELPQGTSSQQYVMTGTNDLALMLSDLLENLQEMANPSSGSGGQGKEIQLPDIIMTQEELAKRMEEGMKRGEEGRPTEEGDKGKEQNSSGKEEGEQRKNEEMSGQLFEIFKQQRMLKQQLENKLKQMGMDPLNSPLLREMEQVEREILDDGFNRQTLEKMNRITHKLLELETAAREQEDDAERKANTNLQQFENKAQDQNLRAKEYFKSTEILNRQSLPLRQIYKTKVKQYFGGSSN